MHHIYHTEAFILASRNVGEANRSFTLFTRELGVVKATAQSVRSLKSKLRYSLQDYSLVKCDLVRGRDIWRIVSAQSLHAFEELKSHKEFFPLVAKVSHLLTKLISGEGENIELYDHIKDSFIAIENNHLTTDELKAFETIIVLEILFHLGYIDRTPELESYIQTPFTKQLLATAQNDRKKLVSLINESLKETQMI
jgi:DNA repair protein RecO